MLIVKWALCLKYYMGVPYIRINLYSAPNSNMTHCGRSKKTSKNGTSSCAAFTSCRALLQTHHHQVDVGDAAMWTREFSLSRMKYYIFLIFTVAASLSVAGARVYLSFSGSFDADSDAALIFQAKKKYFVKSHNPYSHQKVNHFQMRPGLQWFLTTHNDILVCKYFNEKARQYFCTCAFRFCGDFPKTSL